MGKKELLFLFFLLLSLESSAKGNGGELVLYSNKFTKFDKIVTEDVSLKFDFSQFDHEALKCHVDMDILWMSHLDIPIHSTPLIFDIDQDGAKEIVLTTLDHFIYVLDGERGQVRPGWPFAFEDSSFLSSPLLFDLDKDGKEEIVVATKEAEIVFLTTDGKIASPGSTLRVPPLRVPKDWHEGLEGEDIEAALFFYLENDEKTRKQEKKEKQQERQKKSHWDENKKNIFEDSIKTYSTEAISSLDLFASPSLALYASLSHSHENQADPLYSKQFFNYLEEEIERSKQFEKGSFTYIDPHILSTPVICDLENNGKKQLIVTVSYYFESGSFRDNSTNIHKYVASSVVVFDLEEMDIAWTGRLSLTTDEVINRAYVTSSPTVIDLDGDSKMEILVSSGIGHMYVFSANGVVWGADVSSFFPSEFMKKYENKELQGFPLAMDSLWTRPVVADLTGDGFPEIILIDSNSNIACFSVAGHELWTNRISGAPDEEAKIADINLDGTLDIVIGTNVGHIWAVDGKTGENLDNFPMRVGGRVLGKVLVVGVREEGSEKVKKLIITLATDGILYAIDPVTGCRERFDVGDISDTMILYEDLDDSGTMDILLTSTSGNVLAIETKTPIIPLNSWTKSVMGENIFTYQKDYRGIYFTEHTQKFLSGQTINIYFCIEDQVSSDESYSVSLEWGRREVMYTEVFHQSGCYSTELKCPQSVTEATLLLSMKTKHLEVYTDTIVVNFNEGFEEGFHYLIILPLLLLSLGFFLHSPSSNFIEKTFSCPIPPPKKDTEEELEELADDFVIL